MEQQNEALRGPVTNEIRERVEARLALHYAEGRLDLDAYEQRVEQVEQAESMEALAEAISDLEPLEDLMRPRGTGTALVPASPAQAGPVSTALVLASEVPDRRTVLALFSGPRRRGQWIVPRQLKVTAVMGGAELDLREAHLGPGETEIRVTAVLGGVHIVVPPELRVAVEGLGILGGFEDRIPEDAQGMKTQACSIRISGVAVLGGVEVEQRRPGESRWQAKKRQKKERSLQQSQRKLLPPGSGS